MTANHLMLDLETFGVSRDAAIVSIGACSFDLLDEDVNQTLHVKIDLKSDHLGVIDASTVIWWLQQEDTARKALLEGMKTPLKQALMLFQSRVSKETILWSNGPSFDETILHSAFDRCGLPWPLKYNASRDFRTIVQVGETLGVDRVTKVVAHDALADAIDQAKHVQRVFRALKSVNLPKMPGD